MGLDKNDIKALIAILQKGLSDEEDQENSHQEDTVEIKNNIKTKKQSITNSGINKFIELGFDQLHKEDNAIDKLLSKNPPSPRRRRLDQINVRCRLCGREEKINPSMLYESADRYKCNKCCRSPG